LCSAPSPRQRGNIPSMYLATSSVPRGCIQLPSCARICESLPNSVLHSLGRLADSLGWKFISYRAAQAGSRQSFCVCLCLVGPGLSRCLQQLSFCGSLHCIIVWEVVETLKWRDLCRQVAVRGSVSVCILVGPGTPRWFAGFCHSLHWVLVLLTQAGGNHGERKRKETERKQANKMVDWLGLSDPAFSCSQRMNRQVDLQQLPDPAPGCYAL
jgi:hypothetical protein